MRELHALLFSSIGCVIVWTSHQFHGCIHTFIIIVLSTHTLAGHMHHVAAVSKAKCCC